MQKEGLVVSDLHLFSRRSDGEARFGSLVPNLKRVDTLVLNGDIFDFRWALRPLSESIPEAIRWLEVLRNNYPHLEIFFLAGNHDCVTAFTSRVNELEGITYLPHYLILGKNLFLHGDAASFRMTARRFQSFRKVWENDQPKGKLRAFAYDGMDRLRISHATHHLCFAGKTAESRIDWHLDRVIPGWKDHIEDCYFGHTHLPFTGKKIGDIAYHNTGSAIKGMSFHPINFTYQTTK